MSQAKHQLLASGIIICFLFICSISCLVKASPTIPALLIDDVRVAPDLAMLNHKSSITPGYFETSEYLIGDVAVGVIFLESDGTIDPSTEDWTSYEESRVLSEIQVALDWWSSENPSADVTFTLESYLRVPTSYEPINRPSGDQGLWISEAMSYLGYLDPIYFLQVRDYINDLRNYAETDWAFAMFIVDSSNDPDNKFTDDKFAYAYLGGPFMVMTYDNNGWGINNMDRVTAHEIGHIFYATDEYDDTPQRSGYLNVWDVDDSGALMDSNTWWLSTGTMGQIGWRDTDGDGIQDIVDTFPDSTLNPYLPDPSHNFTLTYTGSVTVNPYPNENPLGPGEDVTINTITNVQFRIDNAAWLDANSTDGFFDEATEDFTFTTPPLSLGPHTIETRGINSVGNAETSYSSDVVTIIGDSTPPTTSQDYDGLWQTTNFTINLTAVDDLSGVAETYYKINDGLTKTVSIDGQPLITTDGVNNSLEYWSVDYAENEELPHNTLSGIKLDKLAATGSVTINNGDSYTNSTSVTLSLTATDATSGVDQVRFNNGGQWDSEPWETFSPTKVWTLTSGDGTKTVQYQIRDNAGHISQTYSDTIIFDTTPPTGSITINNQEPYTTTNTVTLTLSATDTASGVHQVRFDNDDLWDSEPWETFSPTKVWTLASGDGTKTVYYQIRDNAGHVSETFSDTIIFDTASPTGSISINDQAAYATTNTVTLSLSAIDTASGVDQVRFNNGGQWDSEPWETFSPTKVWTLTSGDGTKTVQYQIRDNAGHISQTYSDTIIFDTTLPTSSLSINDEATYATTNTVALTLSATDATSGIAEMQFSDDNINWMNWENYAASKAWTFTTGDGTKTVYCQVRDHAGLVSETCSDTIVLDTTPPTILVSSINNGTEVKSSTITATWSGVDDTSNIDHYVIRLNYGSWINTGTSTTYTFTETSDGSHVLDIRAIDKASNYRQVLIRFSVNTSLIGGPGWIDDIIVFGAIGIAISLAAVYLFIKRRAR